MFEDHSPVWSREQEGSSHSETSYVQAPLYWTMEDLKDSQHFKVFSVHTLFNYIEGLLYMDVMMTVINRYYFASISPKGQKQATCALGSVLLAF